MTKTKGKKPTNKDRDKTLAMHDAYIREVATKFNGLYNQVQDFFAVFSMFVELMGKDKELAEFIEKRVKEAKDAEKPKVNILDEKGEVARTVPGNTPAVTPDNKTVDK